MPGKPILHLVCVECYCKFTTINPDAACPDCGGSDHDLQERRKLTTTERHEIAADHGIDTWEDYRGER